MPSDGNKEEEEGDGNVIILCSTDVEQVVPRVRRNENSPKIHPVEQRVPPILGVPNVGRNVSSHSVLSRSTYQTVIIEMTGGGADYCSECDGLASLVKEAYAWLGRDIYGRYRGKPGSEVSLPSHDILRSGKTLMGSLFGGLELKSDIPALINRYMDKELQLDEFVTHEVRFEDINKAFDLLINGQCLRCIIHMSTD
ncbi:hypothetical protein DVH24_020056 [Malus domestica]|uniref:Alcohol dehydrogenase-like C-terminal domain-containing protein n=1 Tax=Malus domestica TaxID=3750 RepID=A0A498JB41_MALDO|nr:hypothetical protein DVH24_020056 [Malus domestica]